MENKVYIISFGNSTKYRITPSNGELADIKSDVKEYLVKKFPEISALNFFDKMTVTAVDASNEAEYIGYSEFDEKSLSEIKSILKTEVETAESVRDLNNNAPWNNL